MRTTQTKGNSKSVGQGPDFELHIRNYEKSGLTMKSYCQSNQFDYGKFYYRYRNCNIKAALPSLQPSIIPVRMYPHEEVHLFS
jgi:hypothetical protein